MREFMSTSRLLRSLNAAPNTRYDIFAINLASVMLGYVYGQTTGRLLSPEMLPTDRGLTYR